jgi:hypothetical protein
MRVKHNTNCRVNQRNISSNNFRTLLDNITGWELQSMITAVLKENIREHFHQQCSATLSFRIHLIRHLYARNCTSQKMLSCEIGVCACIVIHDWRVVMFLRANSILSTAFFFHLKLWIISISWITSVSAFWECPEIQLHCTFATNFSVLYYQQFVLIYLQKPLVLLYSLSAVFSLCFLTNIYSTIIAFALTSMH